MHGHSDGVIANVDVQIGQFCRGKDGLVKILDFNRAEVMLYDEDQGEYCKFENGPPPDGSVRNYFVRDRDIWILHDVGWPHIIHGHCRSLH